MTRLSEVPGEARSEEEHHFGIEQESNSLFYKRNKKLEILKLSNIPQAIIEALMKNFLSFPFRKISTNSMYKLTAATHIQVKDVIMK